MQGKSTVGFDIRVSWLPCSYSVEPVSIHWQLLLTFPKSKQSPEASPGTPSRTLTFWGGSGPAEKQAESMNAGLLLSSWWSSQGLVWCFSGVQDEQRSPLGHVLPFEVGGKSFCNSLLPAFYYRSISSKLHSRPHFQTSMDLTSENTPLFKLNWVENFIYKYYICIIPTPRSPLANSSHWIHDLFCNYYFIPHTYTTHTALTEFIFSLTYVCLGLTTWNWITHLLELAPWCKRIHPVRSHGL